MEFDDETFKKDADHIAGLQAHGFEVVAGSIPLADAHDLPYIQSFTGLVHIGFGNFMQGNIAFVRHDSPAGNRFYTRG